MLLALINHSFLISLAKVLWNLEMIFPWLENVIFLALRSVFALVYSLGKCSLIAIFYLLKMTTGFPFS